jgi:hypothetical protein
MHTVIYASSRIEVWSWYWRAWARPAGLWRFHALFALIFAVGITNFHQHGTFDWGYFFAAAIVGFLTALVLFPLWPQIRFKRSVRSLTINAEGLKTSRGTVSASQTWSEVRSIESSNGAVVITGKNNSAYIVPARAFVNDEKRLDFYESARRWHAAATA